MGEFGWASANQPGAEPSSEARGLDQSHRRCGEKLQATFRRIQQWTGWLQKGKENNQPTPRGRAPNHCTLEVYPACVRQKTKEEVVSWFLASQNIMPTGGHATTGGPGIDEDGGSGVTTETIIGSTDPHQKEFKNKVKARVLVLLLVVVLNFHQRTFSNSK